MSKFIKGIVAAASMLAMSAVFVPQAQAITWTTTAEAIAGGISVANGSLSFFAADTSNQTSAIHGAGFTIDSTTGASVEFFAGLNTWDSYNAVTGAGTGYYDAFIVTISTVGYYWDAAVAKLDPIATGSNTFVWGGKSWSDGILDTYAGYNTVSLAAAGTSLVKYYVSFVLDTSTLPQADTLHPSWGTFTVTSVPEPETYAMMIAGLGLMGFTARRRKANPFA